MKASPKINIFLHSSEVMHEVETKSVDLVLTSPPYNINTSYGGYEDELDIESYMQTISKIIGECSRVIKDNGLVAFNIPEFVKVNNHIYFYPKLYEDMFMKHGLYRKYVNFWIKVNDEGFIDPSNRWDSEYKAQTPNLHSVTEWIMVMGKSDAPPSPSDKNSGDIIGIKRNADKTHHPALWPISLPASIIEKYTSPLQTVLDPFMGIGTTGIACRNLSRHFTGYEVSSEYYELAKKNLLDT